MSAKFDSMRNTLAEPKGVNSVTEEVVVYTGPERRFAPRLGLLSMADFKRFVRTLPKIAKSTSLIGIRQASFDDLPTLLRIEEVTWPEGARASEKMLSSRIEIFPEGVLCATVNDSIVGFSCWQIVSQTPEKIFQSWANLTDQGFIRKTHHPNGLTLFGVSLSIAPSAPKGTIWTISEAAKKLTIRRSLPWAALGSRIPRFHQFSAKMDVGTYIRQFRAGRHLDPELDLYKRVGLTPIRPLPNFFPDPTSCNFGVLLGWKNPFKETRDQLNIWEGYRWFDLWEHKIRRRQKPWQT